MMDGNTGTAVTNVTFIEHFLTQYENKSVEEKTEFLNKVAVVGLSNVDGKADNNAEITYSDLFKKVEALAADIRRQFVIVNDRPSIDAEGYPPRVGIFLKQSIDATISILACMKAGVMYVPLNPNIPCEASPEFPSAINRLSFTIKSSQIKFVLTHDFLSGHPLTEQDIWKKSVRPLNLDNIWEKPESTEVAMATMPTISPEDWAYLVYTSGSSTGKPSGVAVPHGQLIYNMRSLNAVLPAESQINPSSKVAQFVGIGFDAYLYDIMIALGYGAVLYLVPEEKRLSSEALTAYYINNKITHAVLIPSIMSSLEPESLKNTKSDKKSDLKVICSMGETLSHQELARWNEVGIAVVNGYGPTQAVISATISEPLSPEMLDPTAKAVPIGNVREGLSAFVLPKGKEGDDIAPVLQAHLENLLKVKFGDATNAQLTLENLEELSEDVMDGELFLVGKFLSCYWGDDVLNKERFAIIHIGQETFFIYRTLDWVSWGSSAKTSLGFLGRLDDQIKVCGQLVRPIEIDYSLKMICGLEASMSSDEKEQALASMKVLGFCDDGKLLISDVYVSYLGEDKDKNKELCTTIVAKLGNDCEQQDKFRRLLNYIEYRLNTKSMLLRYMRPTKGLLLTAANVNPESGKKKRCLSSDKGVISLNLGGCVAPKDKYEKSIHEVWCKFFKICCGKDFNDVPLSIFESYHSLGGSSYLVGTLFGLIKKSRYGENLKIESAVELLSENVNIFTICQGIRESLSDLSSSVDICYHESANERDRNTVKPADQINIIFIHALYGDAKMDYRKLMPELYNENLNYRIHTIDAPAVMASDLVVLARQYALAICKNKQLVNGKYSFIVGWSAGGVLAYEICRQLKELNKFKSYAPIMLDTLSPTVSKGLSSKESADRIIAALNHIEKYRDPQSLNKASEPEKNNFKAYLELFPVKRQSEIAVDGWLAMHGQSVSDFDKPGEVNQFATMRSLLPALANYNLEETLKYAALIVAAGSHERKYAQEEIFEKSLGWLLFGTGQNFHEVKGTHGFVVGEISDPGDDSKVIVSLEVVESLASITAQSIYNSRMLQIAESDNRFQPPPRNKHFVNREVLVSVIQEKFSVDTARILALTACGMGGVGKTQLATHYYHNPCREYSKRVWFIAETKEQLALQYVDFASPYAKRAKEKGRFIFDDRQPLMEKAERVKDWMGWPEQGRWLIVYDNVPDATVIEGLMPEVGNHHILITSRSKQKWSRPEMIDVDVMTEEEAIELLKNSSGLESGAGVAELVHKLGYLPLAIVQAGVFIRNREMTLDDYIALYDEYQLELLSDDKFLSREQIPIWKTFAMNLNDLEKECPAALKILQYSSFLSSSKIPEILLQGCLKKSAGGVDLIWLEVKATLSKYSLMRIDVEEHHLSMHPLLQDVVRSQLGPWSQVQAFRHLCGAINGLNDYYGEQDSMTYKSLESLLSHAKQLHIHGVKLSKDINMVLAVPEIFLLAGEPECLGSIYYHMGLYDFACDVWKELCQLQEKPCNGSDTVKIGLTLGNLAMAYGSLGNYEEEKKLLERLLKVSEEADLSERLNLELTLESLGQVCCNLGDLEEAKVYLDRSLILRKKRFGEGAFEVGQTLVCLARLYGLSGDPQKRKETLEIALVMLKTRYDSEYSIVSAALQNLGDICVELEFFEKGKEYLEEAVKLQKRHGQSEHVQLGKPLLSLGNVYIALGAYREGIGFIWEALNLLIKRYGARSSVVGRVWSCLGAAFIKSGDVITGRLHLQQSLEIYRSLGIKVPSQLTLIEEELKKHQHIPAEPISMADPPPKVQTSRCLPRLRINYFIRYFSVFCGGNDSDVSRPAVLTSQSETYNNFPTALIRGKKHKKMAPAFRSVSCVMGELAKTDAKKKFAAEVPLGSGVTLDVEYIGSMTNRVGIPQHGYIRQTVAADGNCGFTAFGITRAQALQSLTDGLPGESRESIIERLQPAIREGLLTENFRKYLVEQGLLAEEISLEYIVQNIGQFSRDIVILQGYINYDVRDTNIDAGFAHPGVLQALAHIKKVNLRIWLEGDNGSLTPNRGAGYDYAEYAPPTIERRVDLLFVRGNHFDLVASNQSEQVLAEGTLPVYLLDSPWSQYQYQYITPQPAASSQSPAPLAAVGTFRQQSVAGILNPTVTGPRLPRRG